MKKFVHVESDEEIEIDLSKGLNFACCDCALVHEMNARVDGEKVFVSFRRNNRRTSALRRHHGIPMLAHQQSTKSDSPYFCEDCGNHISKEHHFRCKHFTGN